VGVRLLKIKEFPDYLRLAEDEEALAAFVTGKDEEFIQSLTVDSILAICEHAHDLNFQNACRWANRRANLNEALLPVAQKGMKMQQTLGSFAPTAPSSSAKQ
ncbi:MAG: hypothetical protein ACP5I4_17335, partial [Oceanipulchritudo sp.]